MKAVCPHAADDEAPYSCGPGASPGVVAMRRRRARGRHEEFPDSRSVAWSCIRGTPEALKPVAPGWRGSAYPGLGWLEYPHPEGGAKVAIFCNPSRVDDPFRRFPGYRFATPGYPLQRLRRKPNARPPNRI
jgi:hypothetical protein